MRQESDRESGPIDQMLDLCVFAPVGFVLGAPTMIPKLIDRSRGQVVMARTVGQFAVKRGNAAAGDALADMTRRTVSTLGRIGLLPDDIVRSDTAGGSGGAETAHDARMPGEGHSARAATDTAAAGAAGAAGAEPTSQQQRSEPAEHKSPSDVIADAGPEIDPATLAIPDYDSLSASQVVPRLNSLSVDELAAVGDYEKANRGRKTILNRIVQLQMD